MPTFATSDFYAHIRTTLATADNITEAAVVVILSDAWTRNNEANKTAWTQQLEDDAHAQEAAEDAERLAREQEAEAERAEVIKKRPKMRDFAVGKKISDSIAPRPSTFALNKLENYEYVELWYFCPEGCQDAANNLRTTADETFGLAKIDNIVSIRSISSSVASRHVIKDQDLTWKQMSMGKNAMLQLLQSASWPMKHIRALSNFFVAIDINKLRHEEHGEEILLLYQARARLNWHDALKKLDEEPFDITEINEVLLDKISKEVWRRTQARDEMRRVSPILC
jgi:hypothetical protein